MMGFMIYFVINMRLFKMFKVFLKSGPGGEKSGKWGRIGKKKPVPESSLPYYFQRI